MLDQLFDLVVLGGLVHFQIRRVVDRFLDRQVHEQMIQLVLSDEHGLDLFVLNEQFAVILNVGRAEQTLEKRGLSGARRTCPKKSQLVGFLERKTRLQLTHNGHYLAELYEAIELF